MAQLAGALPTWRAILTSNYRALVQLLHMELDDLFVRWGQSKPLRTGAPHASAILQPGSEWCLRRQVLLALYPEAAEFPASKPWDAHQNAVFLHGWGLHEKYQKLFEQFGEVVEVEHSHFDETRFLHFTPDAITRFAGETYVWEIKGYKQEKFVSLDEHKEPPQAAWHQANLYCHLLGIQKAIVLVENKNTQEIKLWIVEHNAELAWPYTSRMEQVRGSVLKAQRSSKVPVRACLSCTEHRAEKCPVRKLCFSGKLKEKESCPV
jgi:hypothetical protein